MVSHSPTGRETVSQSTGPDDASLTRRSKASIRPFVEDLEDQNRIWDEYIA